MKPLTCPAFLIVLLSSILASPPGVSAAVVEREGFLRAYSENQAVIDLQSERIVRNQSLIVRLMGQIAETRKKIAVSLLRDNEGLTRIRDGEGGGGLLFRPVAPPTVTVDTAGMMTDMDVDSDDPDAAGSGDSFGQQKEDAVDEAEALMAEAETETIDEAQDDDEVLVEVVESVGPEEFIEDTGEELFEREPAPEEPSEFVPEEEWDAYQAELTEWESMGIPEEMLQLDTDDIDWDEVSGEVDSMDLDELIDDSNEAEDLYEDELSGIEDDIDIEIE